MIQSFREYVIEAKQVGTLYHLTTTANLHSILSHGTMYSHNGKISMTRNHSLSTDPGQIQGDLHHSKGYTVRMAFDGDSVSEHHKITPVKGLTFNSPDTLNHEYNAHRVSRHEHENEESVNSRAFKFKSHLKRIDILSDSKEIHDHYHSELKHILDSHNIEHGISKRWQHLKEDVYLVTPNIFYMIEL